MSVTRQHTVWCDECVTWDAVSSQSAQTARKILAKQGWTHRRPNIDHCSECSKSRAKPLSKAKPL